MLIRFTAMQELGTNGWTSAAEISVCPPKVKEDLIILSRLSSFSREPYINSIHIEPDHRVTLMEQLPTAQLYAARFAELDRWGRC